MSAIKHTVTPHGDQHIAAFRDSPATFYTVRVVHPHHRAPARRHERQPRLRVPPARRKRRRVSTQHDDDRGRSVRDSRLVARSVPAVQLADYALRLSAAVYDADQRIVCLDPAVGLAEICILGWWIGMSVLGVSWVPWLAGRVLLMLTRYSLLLKLREIGYLDDGWPQDAWAKLSWQYSCEVPLRAIQIKQGSWLSQSEWEDEWQ
jgi:hypothetical protein